MAETRVSDAEILVLLRIAEYVEHDADELKFTPRFVKRLLCSLQEARAEIEQLKGG